MAICWLASCGCRLQIQQVQYVKSGWPCTQGGCSDCLFFSCGVAEQFINTHSWHADFFYKLNKQNSKETKLLIDYLRYIWSKKSQSSVGIVLTKQRFLCFGGIYIIALQLFENSYIEMFYFFPIKHSMYIYYYITILQLSYKYN